MRRSGSTRPAYSKWRASPNKADRDLAFKAFWTAYNQFTRTFATTLNAHVQSHVTSKDVRNFPTSLDAALFDYNIPRNVYSRLLDDVHANLPTLHRYLKLRQKIMGVEQLGYEDLYAPIVQQVDLQYTPEQGMQMTLDSFAPLGTEYVETLRKGYADRWVDFMPNTGKSPGAYSNTVYGVHPYQLLNFNGAWDDVSTLAHESGHSMHSFMSSAKQPYATASYSTFVAEVASTLNENLLLHHVLDQTQGRPDAALPAVELPRQHAHDAVPADAVRRVRAQDPRDGRARRAAHRGFAQHALPRAAAPVLRARRGRRAGR